MVVNSVGCPDCGADVPLRLGSGTYPHRKIGCRNCGWLFYVTPDDRVTAIRKAGATGGTVIDLTAQRSAGSDLAAWARALPLSRLIADLERLAVDATHYPKAHRRAVFEEAARRLAGAT
jgi:hypothetical protein